MNILLLRWLPTQPCFRVWVPREFITKNPCWCFPCIQRKEGAVSIWSITQTEPFLGEMCFEAYTFSPAIYIYIYICHIHTHTHVSLWDKYIYIYVYRKYIYGGFFLKAQYMARISTG